MIFYGDYYKFKNSFYNCSYCSCNYCIIEGLNVFSLSGLVPDFVFYGSLAIIIAILGLLGVYISKMDIRIAAIQYIILGLGLFIAIGYYGVIGCVIFIVAGVLAIAEYVQTKEEVTPDKKLFLIPVLTIIIIVLFLLASAGLGVLDSMAASDSVSFSGLSAAISNDYGVTSGDLTGTLNVDKDFDYLEVKVRFYNSNNLTLYESYAYTGSNVPEVPIIIIAVMVIANSTNAIIHSIISSPI